MKLQAHGITDVGCVRTNNEDNFVCDTKGGLFAVCDGMGGHAAGEVASAMACALLTEKVEQLKQDVVKNHATINPFVAQRLTDAMSRAMADISQRIIEKGQAQAQVKGMGTTCTALWFIDDAHALVAHVGDSRLYVISASDAGTATRDHTLVEELIARGLIHAADAKRHPQAHILSRALGASSGLGADCFLLRVEAGDKFLLCSDGLHAYLPELPPLAAMLQDTATDELGPALQNLIDDAKQEGGHDNLTGVLVHLTAGGEDGLPQITNPWATTLEVLKNHPAVAQLPPMLLRRLAALVVPIVMNTNDPHAPQLPASGIYWVMEGTLTVREPGGTVLEIDAKGYWAPHPVGHLGDDAPVASLSATGKLLYLAETALQTACAANPTLGAILMDGLLQNPS